MNYPGGMTRREYKKLSRMIHLKARKYIGWYGIVWADLPDLKQECWLRILAAYADNPDLFNQPGLVSATIKADLLDAVRTRSFPARRGEAVRLRHCHNPREEIFKGGPAVDVAENICAEIDFERILPRLTCAEQELIELLLDGFNVVEIACITGEAQQTLDNRQKKLWRMLK